MIDARRKGEGGAPAGSDFRRADPVGGTVSASILNFSEHREKTLTIINGADARAAGLRRYFTGKACKHGHRSERRVSDGKCLACRTDERLRKRLARTPKPPAARTSRHDAMDAGATRYVGASCGRCGGTVRAVTSRCCVECQKARQRRPKDFNVWLARGFRRTRKEPAVRGASHVYVIVAGEFCKIGVALDPHKRLLGVKTGCPIPPDLFYVTDAMPRALAHWVERAVHVKFVDQNTNREWFRITPEDARAAIQLVELFA